MEVDGQPRGVADHEQRLVAGHVADIGAALQHHAVDGRDDIVRLKALVAFHARQPPARRDGLADGLVHRQDLARKTRTQHGARARRQVDAAKHVQGFLDHGGTDGLNLDPRFARGLPVDRRPALVGRIGPGEPLSPVDGGDAHVERMRFDHLAGGGEIRLLRLKREPVDRAVQPLQLDGQVDPRRVDRLTVEIGIDVEPGRHAGLENGDLKAERPVRQQPAPIWPALIVRLRSVVVAVVVGSVVDNTVAAGGGCDGQDGADAGQGCQPSG